MCAWLFDLSDVSTISEVSRTMNMREVVDFENIPWLWDNIANVDGPSLELTTDAGLEFGREIFLDLEFITELVTFCHRSLIGVREQRCEPLDIVVRLLE